MGMAAKKPAGWSAADCYGQLASKLEEGQNQLAEIVPLHRFMEDEDWADLTVRPRQRLLFKVTDNAIHKRDLVEGLTRIPLRGRQSVDAEDDLTVAQRMALLMPHACWHDPDEGCFVYDEAADWAYLLEGQNKYARALTSYDPASKEPLTLVFVMGRGSSKTTYMSAGIGAWMTHRILASASPHGMFGLSALKPLRVQNVATSQVQAGEFFDSYRTMIERVRWFDGKYDPPGVGLIKFGKHLYAERSSSSSKSTRGRDTVCYFHDEIAFADKTAGPRSDRKLYDAIRKAVKTRAKGKGLVVVVSSPAEADGVLYELVTQAEAGTLANAIVVQMATWEMIPGQVKDDYASEYRADEDVAEMEYGSQFYTGSSNLLPDVRAKFGDMAALYRHLVGDEKPCIFAKPETKDRDVLDADALYVKKQRRYPRVLHVDTSEGGDRLVATLLHVRDRRVVVDLVRAWPRQVSYSRELFPWIKDLASRFGIDRATFDQMDSLQLIQDLNDIGVNAEKTAFTQQYNDLMARNLKTLVTEGMLALYPVDKTMAAGLDRVLDRDDWVDDPEKWPWVSMAILQREMWAAKKVIKGAYIAAEAPTAGPVQTDDALDALMAAAYQAILLNGGLGEFFDLPRAPEGVRKTDELPDDQRLPAGFREVMCPHHKGLVTVDATERYAPCPTCKNLIQTKL
jgi:hypothetical protein